MRFGESRRGHMVEKALSMSIKKATEMEGGFESGVFGSAFIEHQRTKLDTHLVTCRSTYKIPECRTKSHRSSTDGLECWSKLLIMS